MNQIEAFEILFQSSINHLVAAFEPGKSGHIVAPFTCLWRIVQVDEQVIVTNHIVQCGQYVPVIKEVF